MPEAQLFLRLFDGKELVDAPTLVRPAVFGGKVHPVEEQTVEHFGVGGNRLVFLLCEQSLWDFVKDIAFRFGKFEIRIQKLTFFLSRF